MAPATRTFKSRRTGKPNASTPNPDEGTGRKELFHEGGLGYNNRLRVKGRLCLTLPFVIGDGFHKHPFAVSGLGLPFPV